MYIDIHSHILPGIDDGARSLQESDSMLDTYASLGFSTVVATPHVTIEDIGYQGSISDDLMRQVRPATTAFSISIQRAGEIRLDPGIAAEPHLLRGYTLDGSRYLLVDFSSGSWPFYAEDTLFQIQMQGFTPILAHPERYGWSTDQRYLATDLVSRGVLLQVTLGSMTGTFGKSAAMNARALLQAGLVHVLASDAHGPGTRLTAAGRGIEWTIKHYGEDAIEQFLIDAPKRILASEQVGPFVPAHRTGWQSTLRNLWPF
ncbi:MAG: hypothetical protein M9950_08640 [Thermomicrobiales bacterium]|nr:hypothetical protein [Thermomicrobiales bacterium]